jgi:hypothetical protein
VALFKLVAALDNEIDSFAQLLSIGQLGILLRAQAGRCVVPFKAVKIRDFGIQRRDLFIEELSGRGGKRLECAKPL